MAQKALQERFAELNADDLHLARALLNELDEKTREVAQLEGRIVEIHSMLAGLAHREADSSPTADAAEYALRSMSAEVAAVTRQHPSTERAQLDRAERMCDDYPATQAALARGEISPRHADVVMEAGKTLDAAARASLDQNAIPFAATSTPGKLKKVLQLQAEQLAPKSLTERHRAARRDRRVTVTDLDDGMSELFVIAPTLELRGIQDRLTQMASAIKTDRRRARRDFRRQHGYEPEEGWLVPVIGQVDGADPQTVAASDRRTMDQLRADLLTDLLLTSAPTGHDLLAAGSGAALAAISATVQVTIPADELCRPSARTADPRGTGSHRPAASTDAPGRMPQVGIAWMDRGSLVSPDTARVIAGGASGWDRLFLSPDGGEIRAVDRYRPSENQRRMLVARDLVCRFPGCSRDARSSDIDHTQDYARGGKTDIDNLACLCEAHHMVKHQSDWSVTQVGGGVLAWRSPTGRVFYDEPLSRHFFSHSAEAAADTAARERAAREESDAHRVRLESRSDAADRVIWGYPSGVPPFDPVEDAVASLAAEMAAEEWFARHDGEEHLDVETWLDDLESGRIADPEAVAA